MSLSTERQCFAGQLKRFLTRYDRFLLSGHIRPDGDSVAVCAALSYALLDMGKEVYTVLDGDAARYTELLKPFPILPEEVSVKHASRCFESGDSFAFIIMDCSDPQRTGRAEEALLLAEASLTIDHHITSMESGDFNYVEPHCSSASEVLYSLLKLCEIPITLPMAEALFMGLAFDTGGLRHRSATEETFQMAYELKKLGVDTTRILDSLFHTSSLNENRARALAVQKSHVEEDGILLSDLTLEDCHENGLNPGDAEGVSGDLIEIREAKVACFLREIKKGCVRVSLRSKPEIDVARVASLFGGGGHVQAAGCTFVSEVKENGEKETSEELIARAKQALCHAIRCQRKARG